MIQQVSVNGELVIPLKNGCALVASHNALGSWHAVNPQPLPP